MMTYDLNGAWNTWAAHHSPLFKREIERNLSATLNVVRKHFTIALIITLNVYIFTEQIFAHDSLSEDMVQVITKIILCNLQINYNVRQKRGFRENAFCV